LVAVVLVEQLLFVVQTGVILFLVLSLQLVVEVVGQVTLVSTLEQMVVRAAVLLLLVVRLRAEQE
jgi:hypothetical protein